MIKEIKMGKLNWIQKTIIISAFLFGFLQKQIEGWGNGDQLGNFVEGVGYGAAVAMITYFMVWILSIIGKKVRKQIYS